MNPTIALEIFDESRHQSLIGPLTELLHNAYGPLAAKGLRYLATHQPPETTLKRLKKGNSFLLFDGDDPVATITLVRSNDAEDCEWYRRPGLFYFTQFAVNPKYQGQGLGRRLMDFVENIARENGGREMALDTSEHASELISMYRARNYEPVAHHQWDVTNYRSVILSKNLHP